MSHTKLPSLATPQGLWEDFREWLLPRKIDNAPKRAALLLRWAGRAAALAEIDLPSALAAFQASYDKASAFRAKLRDSEINAHPR